MAKNKNKNRKELDETTQVAAKPNKSSKEGVDSSVFYSYSKESSAELAKIADKISKHKIKIVSGTYKDVLSITEGIESKIKRLGMDSFYEWFMDKGQHMQVETDHSFKPNEGIICENTIILPSDLTSEQQITYGSLLAMQMLSEVKGKKSDGYELEGTVGLLINYLLHQSYNGGSGAKRESVSPLIIRTQQIGKAYSSLYKDSLAKIAKFHSLKPEQEQDLEDGFIFAQERLVTTTSALQLIGSSVDFRKESKESRTLGLENVLNGSRTVTSFLDSHDVLPNITELPEFVRQYVKK